MRLAALAIALLPMVATAQEGALFVPAGAEADRLGPSPVGVTRARAVGVNLAALPGADGQSPLPPAGHSILLNLFDDTTYVAHLMRSERIDRGMSWVGRIEGQPLSNVVLVTYDGVLTGSVVWPEGAYRIAFDGSSSVVQQLDHDLFPEGDCVRDASLGVAELDAPPPAAADSGALVDVLVSTPRPPAPRRGARPA